MAEYQILVWGIEKAEIQKFEKKSQALEIVFNT